MVTQEYRVEGPVMLFLTTTAISIDEELMNRCLVLSVDEGRAQTEAIHRLQRRKRTLQGLMARAAKDEIVALASQRAAAVAAPGGGQSLCRQAQLPVRQDAHAARPREVSDPHRRDCACCTSISAT